MDSRLFFMLGAPRSGTTILYHILNLHPKVFMSNEWAIPELVSHLNHYTHYRPWVNKEFMRDYLTFFYRKHSLHKPTAYYLGDKYPGGHGYFQVLKLHLPWMFFIETRRNPYEQVASGLSRSDVGWKIPFDVHVQLIADSFDTHRQAEKEGFSVSRINLEELIANPNKVLGTLCFEMDIPAGERFLKDAHYLIKNIPKKSEDILSQEQIQFINDILGDRILQMGYEVK